MPLATLSYELPNEQLEFDDAHLGHKWRAVVWDFRQELRSLVKHGGRESFTYEELTKMLATLHEDNGLQLE